MSAISVLSSSAGWVWWVAIGGEGRGVLGMSEGSRDALGRYTGNGKGEGLSNQFVMRGWHRLLIHFTHQLLCKHAGKQG